MQTRSSGLFSGLVLLSVGILLLLHNYGHLELHTFFTHWWPLLIIFWGVVKLYERTVGRRFGGSGGTITGGEVFLVFAMLALLGMVVAVDYSKEKLGDTFEEIRGDNYGFDVDVTPKAIPAKAPVVVRTIHGDLTVRASDDAQIHVSGKKNVRTWSEEEAGRIAKPGRVEISQNGDGFEVHPSGFDASDARISVNLEVAVPKKSPLTVRTERGDVVVSDMAASVAVVDQNGDVEIRGTDGDVSVEMRKGDVKTNDTKGDVRVSGKGGEIEVNNATGSLTVDGDFYGPVRADKVTKGVRMVSAKTDLTVSALAGHLEAGSGNLDLIDAPGNVTLRTRDMEVNVENAGGKLVIDNRNAQTNVRFTAPPKDDVQITNSSAGISLTVPGSSSFEIQADCRNCDIESEFSGLGPTKSESGDSHVAGKYGSGKGPKITLKTSYGNIVLRRTALAIPVPPKAPVPPAPPTPIPPATEQ
ncbi:MAG TPA: DUF4097 family beta strand repeat-containing protein [Candidatus Sulfotelmatobacter sp.]|nr:DUF4097 family beta strand repeat-containing protein [Candidatus Sulfotelmatobacter sp.]